jgi:methylglyoxal synthase
MIAKLGAILVQLLAGLAASKLGAYLSAEQLECLAAYMRVHEVPAGGLIVEGGTPAGFVALVVSGEVVVIGDDVKVARLGEGAFFGEAMFSDQPTRTADVRAVGCVTCGLLVREDFERLLDSHRDIALRCQAFFASLYDTNRERRLGDQARYIALIAHDAMKPVLVDFASAYRERLESYPLVATSTTGRLLYRSTGLLLSRKVQSGPLGGDQAIGALIASGNIRAVIFFRDPLAVHPHHADIAALGRLCDVYYVPFATNPATAESVLMQLEQGPSSLYASTSPGGHGRRPRNVAVGSQAHGGQGPQNNEGEHGLQRTDALPEWVDDATPVTEMPHSLDVPR